MKYYAYCVTRREIPEVNRPGIENQILENLQFDDVIVVVSKFAGDIVQVTRPNVLAHEAVVRAVMSFGTPLPFRFGTLVSEVGLRNFVEARRQSLVARLDAIQNCVEMSVKIIWPNRPDNSSENAIDTGNVGAGTAFLRNKKQELLGDERLHDEAEEIRRWLTNGLQGKVRQEFVTVEPKSKIVVSSAYLIEKSTENEFKNSVKVLQKSRPELHFLTSGPWPPYTFANIDLEFETQFGVS